MAELLDATDGYGALAEVQRRVLEPPELKFAARAGVARWGLPEWVAGVEAALSGHRGRTEAQ